MAAVGRGRLTARLEQHVTALDSMTLGIERTCQVLAERVFDAGTSAEVMRRWWQAEVGWESPRPRSTCVWAAPCGSSCATRTRVGGAGSSRTSGVTSRRLAQRVGTT